LPLSSEALITRSYPKADATYQAMKLNGAWRVEEE
jgi:hypothetical protein